MRRSLRCTVCRIQTCAGYGNNNLQESPLVRGDARRLCWQKLLERIARHCKMPRNHNKEPICNQAKEPNRFDEIKMNGPKLHTLIAFEISAQRVRPTSFCWVSDSIQLSVLGSANLFLDRTFGWRENWMFSISCKVWFDRARRISWRFRPKVRWATEAIQSYLG